MSSALKGPAAGERWRISLANQQQISRPRTNRISVQWGAFEGVVDSTVNNPPLTIENFSVASDSGVAKP